MGGLDVFNLLSFLYGKSGGIFVIRLLLIILLTPFWGCAEPASRSREIQGDSPKVESPIIDTLDSEILKDKIEYYVYLPQNYTPEKKWSVVYLLHSAGGSAFNWMEWWKIHQALEGKSFIAVAPNDADGLRWWLNSPVLPNSDYSKFLVEELKPHINSIYPTYKAPNQTGVMGFSMGGFGTIHNISQHPDEFQYGYSINGCINLIAWNEEFGLRNVLGSPQKHPKHWFQVNPLKHPERFKGLSNRLFIQTSDEDWFLEENRQFHQMLDSMQIEHGYLETEGGHFSPDPQRMEKITAWFDSCFTNAPRQ